MTNAVIGGWEPVLEAGLRADAATFDSELSRFDTAQSVFDADGQPLWVDLRCRLLSVECDAGAAVKPDPGVIAEAGRLTASFWDPLGDLDPTAGAFGQMLRPGTPIRVLAVKGAESAPVWTGTADAWTHDLLTREGALEATDLVARLAQVPVVAFHRPAETVPQRIAALVALMPDPPPLDLRGTGTRALAACTMTGDLWQVLRSVVETDMSWLWFDASGTLVWQGRGIAAEPSAVLVDCPGAEPWDGVYLRLPVLADEQQIINLIEAQRAYPAEAEAPDPFVYAVPASVAAHDPHTYAAPALQVATDAEVDAWAEEVLQLRAWPVPRPVEAVLTAADELEWDAPTMDTIAGLDLAHQVRVRLTTRAPERAWDAVVSRLAHRITPTEWECTVSLGRVEAIGAGGFDAPDSLFDATRFPV